MKREEKPRFIHTKAWKDIQQSWQRLDAPSTCPSDLIDLPTNILQQVNSDSKVTIPQKLQTTITQHREKKMSDLFVAQLPPVPRARFSSLTSCNNHRWLSVLPTEKSVTINDQHFVNAVAHRLGIHTPTIREHDVFQCKCGCMLSSDHRHFHVCKQLTGGGKLKAHDIIVHTIKEGLREIGVTAINEPHYTTTTPTHRRSDLLVFTTHGSVYVDVAIVQPDAENYRQQRQTFTQEIAMNYTENRKRARLSHLSPSLRSHFTPFVCTTYGFLNQPAMLFLRKMSKFAESSEVWMDTMLNRIACILQCSNSLISSIGLHECSGSHG
jgi:hypothetical protein